ncbi:unnamed protein product [Paramecium pentaurelia]|uniref:PPM-type phosphatase domain-containing protein n=1 Tax=Paramecium pentaurelia TaxID=43138 RepID=A0A8S1XQ86_9CILI|nr:unnamed protein product [Paramecium pentaurelia]
MDIGTTSSKYQGNLSLPFLPPLKNISHIEYKELVYNREVPLLKKLQQDRIKRNGLYGMSELIALFTIKKQIFAQDETNTRNQGNQKIQIYNTREEIRNKKLSLICNENQGRLLIQQSDKNKLRYFYFVSKEFRKVQNIFISSMGYKFFAVCDEHGQYGHMVSNQIKQQLPKHLGQYLKELGYIENQILKAFEITNKELCYSEIDTNLSGSTTLSLLIIKDIVYYKIKQIYSANVGDSRAIMCKFDNGWTVTELSRDHKQDDPQEKKRILDADGRVEQQKDYHGNGIGPYRVFLSYIQAPGLTMTRSFGNKVGAQAGVIAEPEIQQFSISAQDQFIIIALDGVWEYMSNEEVMTVVIPFLEKDEPDQEAECVVIEATQAWRRQGTILLVQLYSYKNENQFQNISKYQCLKIYSLMKIILILLMKLNNILRHFYNFRILVRNLQNICEQMPLKKQLVSRRRKEMQQSHYQQEQEIERAHFEEFNQFNQFWDEKMQKFTDEASTELERTLPQKPKESYDILNLKKREEYLAKQKKYSFFFVILSF